MDVNVRSTTLAIEYRQWKFSVRLSRQLCEWITSLAGIRTKHSEARNKECRNIFDRWILSVHQCDLPRDSDLPLFPCTTVDHPINTCLAEEMARKFKCMHSVAKEIIRRLVHEVELFRQECRAGPEPKPPKVLCVRKDADMAQLVIGDLETLCNHRVHFLVTKFGQENTAKMMLRYEAVGCGSYQWGDSISVHKTYYNDYGARYEGFSSPLNSRFLGQEGTHICSLFLDTDAVFGSLGNFFTVDFAKHSGGWSVNPPYIESLLEKVSRKLIEVLDAGIACYFFLNYPKWTDSVGWQLMDESVHKTARFDFNPGEFLIQDAYGRSFRPRMVMSIFVMGKLPADAPPVSHVWTAIHKDVPPDY